MNRPPLLPIHLGATVLMLAATLTATKLTAERHPEPLTRPLDMISRSLAGFTAADNPPLDQYTLAALRPTSYLVRTYTKGNLGADLFIAFYAEQRAGESMHSPKHCLPGSGWEIWNYGALDVPVEGRVARINQYSISQAAERREVLYWYQSKSRIIASEYLGKLLLARDTLMQRGTSAAIVRIIVPQAPEAVSEGRALAGALIPQLQHCFE
jgi:EpsI family protein